MVCWALSFSSNNIMIRQGLRTEISLSNWYLKWKIWGLKLAPTDQTPEQTFVYQPNLFLILSINEICLLKCSGNRLSPVKLTNTVMLDANGTMQSTQPYLTSPSCVYVEDLQWFCWGPPGLLDPLVSPIQTAAWWG